MNVTFPNPSEPAPEAPLFLRIMHQTDTSCCPSQQRSVWSSRSNSSSRKSSVGFKLQIMLLLQEDTNRACSPNEKGEKCGTTSKVADSTCGKYSVRERLANDALPYVRTYVRTSIHPAIQQNDDDEVVKKRSERNRQAGSSGGSKRVLLLPKAAVQSWYLNNGPHHKQNGAQGDSCTVYLCTIYTVSSFTICLLLHWHKRSHQGPQLHRPLRPGCL